VKGGAGATPLDVEPAERPLVVHVVHALGVGGLENGLVNLLNGAVGQQFRHAIVCLTQAGAFRQRVPAGVDIYELHRHAGQDFGMLWRLWRLLRRLRPVLVHTRNLGTLDCQWVAWAAGVPRRLHSEHGWGADDPRGMNPRHRLLRKLCAPVVQQYLAMSRDIASWLERDIGLPAARIAQVYNGVDLSRFHAGAAQALPLTGEPPPWPRGSFVVGCVARLDPVKDPEGLVAAFAEFRSRVAPTSRPVWLAWVGDGPALANMQAAVARAGLQQCVWLPGARNDIPALVSQFDVFALASLNEGISNTLLEAMACGCPVVARRVGGNPEVVRDGQDGQLVDASAATAFAAPLEAYFRQPELRARHSAAARSAVEQRFSLDAMQQGYLQLYRRLLAN
jgi:sugar transferase (PEP-CTERM/EpsH1 system associated)